MRNREAGEPAEPFVEFGEVGIEPELVEHALKEALQGLRSILSRLDELRELRERFLNEDRIRVLGKGGPACYFAVDSGFTLPPIEVLGGYLSLIQVATVPYGKTCSGAPERRLYVRFRADRDDTDAMARVLEREHAMRGLNWLSRVSGRKALLIDGEVVPRFGARRRGSGDEVVAEAIKKSRELIREALDLGIPVIGVLKRSFSRDVVVAEGLGPELSDRALTSAVLKEGEYFVAGTYREVYEGFSAKAPEELRWRVDWLRWVSEDDIFANVIVAFYRPHHVLFPAATKVEMALPSGLDVGDVLADLAAISESTGLPAPIDYVDSLSRITPEMIYTVYQLLLTKLSAAERDAARVLLAIVNPQKLGPLGFIT